MPTEREGTGRSTTFFDDPPQLTLAGVGTNHYFDSPDGIGATVAPANHGRIRYNNTSKKWEVSTDSGLYQEISTGSGSIGGSGTAGRIPKFSASTTLTDSIMNEHANGIDETKTINAPSWFQMINADSGVSAKSAILCACDTPNAEIEMNMPGSGYTAGDGHIALEGGFWTNTGAIGLALFAKSGYIRVSGNNITLSTLGVLTTLSNLTTSGGDVIVSNNARFVTANNFAVLVGGNTMAFTTSGGLFTFDSAINAPIISLTGAGTSHYYESVDGQTAPVSGAATGRIRYNDSTGKWQVSTQTGAYADIATGAGSGITGSGTTGKLSKFTAATAIGDSLLVETTNEITMLKSNNGHTGFVMDNPDNSSISALALYTANNDADHQMYIGISSTTYDDGGTIPADYGMLMSSSDAAGLVIGSGFNGLTPLKIMSTTMRLSTVGVWSIYNGAGTPVRLIDLDGSGNLNAKDGAASVNFNQYGVFTTGGMVFTTGNDIFSWVTTTERMRLTSLGALTVASSITSTAGDINVADSAHFLNANNFSTLAAANTMTFATGGTGAYTFDSNQTITGTTLWTKSVNGPFECKIKNTSTGGNAFSSIAVENSNPAKYCEMYIYSTGHALANQFQMFHQGAGITIWSFDAGSFLKLYAPEVTMCAAGAKYAFFDTAPVVQGAAVADASGGVVIDAEARTAINAVLNRLRTPGFIAT